MKQEPDYRLKENQKYECDSCNKIVSYLITRPEYDGMYCQKCFDEKEGERK